MCELKFFFFSFELVKGREELLSEYKEEFFYCGVIVSQAPL